MSYQNIFKRYEIKYKLNKEQKDELQLLINQYMTTNEFSFSTIRNIYFDTDNYRLIRTSLEKPVYKEKLRIRSYKTVNSDEDVFVELKKKYDSVVYKRRITVPEKEAMSWLIYGSDNRPKTQIGNEIEYFCEYYGELIPAVFLSYDREAYQGKEDKEFRLTLDNNILVRQDNLSLRYEPYGTNILDENEYLMEVKTTGAIPLWLAHFLADEKIYKTSFSKYGTAYQKIIFPQWKINQGIHGAQPFAEKIIKGENQNYDKHIQWAI